MSIPRFAIELRRFLNAFLNRSLPYVLLKLENLQPKLLQIYFPSDAFGAIEENLFHNIYFDPEHVHSADTIIDLGAHAGGFTTYAILHSKPRARIIAVEPCERNYELLLTNIRLFKKFIEEKRLEILVLRKAVWSRRGKVSFVYTGWSEGGFVNETQSGSHRVHVESTTLDDLITLSKGIIIVKMDIEGAEVPVLASSRLLNRISRINIEAHGKEHVIAKLLRAQGFRCKTIQYRLNPSLFKEWLKFEPKSYAVIIAIYRLLVSSISSPTITLVKAENPKM